MCVCLPDCCRLCARWSRTTQPGNRGWPSSWSKWWPSWVWRAEDCTSQGALGRDPIRNRAVPEWRPVPLPSSSFLLPPPFFRLLRLLLIMWLPRLSEMASSSTFSLSCFLQPEKIFLFNSSTLLHRLVLPEHTWRVVPGLKLASPTVQCTEGWFGKLAILAFGCSLRWKEWKREKTNFLCCLQEFTLIGDS